MVLIKLLSGQTFGISLTTLRKKDWRFILLNCSTCESVIETFSDVAHLTTMGDWTDVYGKHWESEQNVVTSQLLRLGLCSVPKTNRLAKMFMQNYNMSDNLDDSKTCYKGQGYGECRSWNLGNTWYEEVGGCPWYHHWYPLELLQAIVKHNQEEDFMRMFQDHFMHDGVRKKVRAEKSSNKQKFELFSSNFFPDPIMSIPCSHVV